MLRRRTGAVALILSLTCSAAVLFGPTASAAAPDCFPNRDNGDPVLDGLTISPSSVNVTSAPKTVTFVIDAHDTGGPGAASGISGFGIGVTADDSFGFRFDSVGPATKVGDHWEAEFEVPRGDYAGNWTVFSVTVYDKAGQSHFYSDDALQSGPFDTGFQVVSTHDTAPPSITSITVEPGSIDTTSGPKQVAISAVVTDAISGVDSVRVSLGQNTDERSAILAPTTGNTFEGTATFPAWYGGGSWSLKGATVIDKVGNRDDLFIDEVQAISNRPGITVVSGVDNGDPTATSYEVKQAKVNVTKSAKFITVTVRAKDPNSGVASVSAGFRNGDHGFAGSLKRVSGTAKNGVWKGKVKIKQCGSVSGKWTGNLSVVDKAGNSANYDAKYDTFEPGWQKTVKVVAPDTIAPGAAVVKQYVEPAEPLRLRFNETARGLKKSSALVEKIGTEVITINGAWTCKNKAGKKVSCKKGKVRTASFDPAADLETFTAYRVTLNPEHSLAITDSAGNPMRRVRLEYYVPG